MDVDVKFLFQICCTASAFPIEYNDAWAWRATERGICCEFLVLGYRNT